MEDEIQKDMRMVPMPAVVSKEMAKHEGDPIKQCEYRSFVGKIKYFQTNIGPSFANALGMLFW